MVDDNVRSPIFPWSEPVQAFFSTRTPAGRLGKCYQDLDFFSTFFLNEKVVTQANIFYTLFLKIKIKGLEGACSLFLRS